MPIALAYYYQETEENHKTAFYKIWGDYLENLLI
jgi:hypothetical protein